MAEIYRDATDKGLVLDIPTATATKAKFTRDGSVVAEYTTMPNLSSNTAKVPYEITQFGGGFSLEWTYTIGSTEYTRTEEHQIVTPVFTKTDLVAWDADFSTLTDQKVVYLERLVRQIIETYCNQSFDLVKGTRILTWRSPNTYLSPERVVHLDDAAFRSIDGTIVENVGSYTSVGINIKTPIEADIMEYWHDPDMHRPVKSVAVTGLFGWTSIPEEVKTAALYLAEAFTCDESLWRERFIKSVRASDWRFDYTGEAFRSTGSLIADQLLDPFVMIGFRAV